MYYIYHIPGVKIGCTEQEPLTRVKQQGYTHFEILEEHTCIFEASRREIELQKKRGYPVDRIPYWQTRQLATFESCSKGAKNVPHEARSRGAKNQPREAKSLGGKTNRLLTFFQAEEIRNRYTQGGITRNELAELWGLTYSSINKIIRKESYKEP